MNNELISNEIITLFQSYKLVMRSTLKANEIGLNAMFVKLLSFIHKEETCTANDIVNNLNKDKAQIARLLKEMIAKKWLIKKENLEDKRSQLLSLTNEGNKLAKLINQTEMDINSQIKNNLTPNELAEFIRISHIISASLKQN